MMYASKVESYKVAGGRSAANLQHHAEMAYTKRHTLRPQYRRSALNSGHTWRASPVGTHGVPHLWAHMACVVPRDLAAVNHFSCNVKPAGPSDGRKPVI